MNKVYDIVLFDLDGTLIDSGTSIISCISRVLSEENIALPAKSELRRFIGPPLQKGLEDICGFSKDISKLLTKKYRAYYEEHYYKLAQLYPGVLNLLSDLKAAGCLITTATSRPETSALRTMKYYNLDKLLDVIVTAKDERPDIPKKELIETAIGKCSEIAGKKDLKSIMVGDTYYDMTGAKLAAVPAIGVTYGYGTKQELLENGADFLASSVEELRKLLIN